MPFRFRSRLPFTLLMLGVLATPAFADKYSDAIRTFRNAGQSAHFFNNCYGYALFPTIGKGGIGIGGARGTGHVYRHGAAVGTSTTTSYIESASGINAGGRTGLMALTVAVLFTLTPIAYVVSAAPNVASFPMPVPR